MKIIIRCSGERTEKKCISLAKMQGSVHIIRAIPFGETLRQAYKLATELNQEWVPMIDADVLLSPGTLKKAMQYLKTCRDNIFCLDGKTKDKIFLRKRRAGIHIYRTSMLSYAKKFIDNKQLKPESHVRKEMSKMGYLTVPGPVVFGLHDYEQYYRDLWRKAVMQTQKLAGMIRRSKIPKRWKILALADDDFRVILAAHRHGMEAPRKIRIDSRIDYGSTVGIKRLCLKEKGELK